MGLQSLNESLESKYNFYSNLDEGAFDTIFNKNPGRHAQSKSSDYIKKADDLEKKTQKLRAAYRFADAERTEAEANMYRNKAQAVNDSKAGGEPNLSNMTSRDYLKKISEIFKNAPQDKLKGTYEYYIWKTQQYFGLSEYGRNPIISQIQNIYKDIVDERTKQSEINTTQARTNSANISKNTETTQKLDKSKQIEEPDIDDYTGVLMNVLNQAINDKDISCNSDSYKKLIASFRTEVLALLQGKRLG